MTALMFAAVYGYVEAVKALVAADPDPAHIRMKSAANDEEVRCGTLI